jgi:3-dehydroquinate synthetase
MLGLPVSYPRDQWRHLFELMQKDKKKRNHVRFVTLTEIGKPVRLENVEDGTLQSIYEEVVGR